MAELVVGLENNQKILIPTSSEARSGNPLGSKIALQNNVVPIGYVKCDGQQFDSTQYPALYAYLGTDVAPCEFDHSRIDNDIIRIDNVYTTPYTMLYDGIVSLTCDSNSRKFVITFPNGEQKTISTGGVHSGENNSFTLELQKGTEITADGSANNPSITVQYYKHYLCIKATSGLEETQQDYVLQSLLEADSYSTEEVATGKKWIDGKMIYRKVIHAQSITFPYSVASLNIDYLVDMRAIGNNNSGHNNWISANLGTQGDIYLTNDKANIAINTFDPNIIFTDIILEYTKAD